DFRVAFDMNGTVTAERQRRAQLFGGLVATDGDGDDFVGDAGLLPLHGLFQRDFIERVDAVLDAVGDDAAVVRLDLNAHVVINGALYAYEYFHGSASKE